MTTDPDIIDQAEQVMHDFAKDAAENGHIRGWHSMAKALADAGLLTPKCDRECEALRDWDALVAERDEMAAENQRLKAGNEALRQDIPDGDLVELKAEWKACAEQLAAERDKAIAERNMAVGKVDEMRQRLAQVRKALADAWDDGHEWGAHNEHEFRPGRKIPNPWREAD